MLFGYEYELTQSPAGAHQWRPKNATESDLAPEVDGSTHVPTMMATTDLALKEDPGYEKLRAVSMQSLNSLLILLLALGLS